MKRGLLGGSHTTLTSSTFAQCWTLDETGNWHGFCEDHTGDGTWDMIQTRSANAVNEIAQITESEGPSWVTPMYSRAGNMTVMPQPEALESSYTATYDGWSRLTMIVEGEIAIADYSYDGTQRRNIQSSHNAGQLDKITHLYYTEPNLWQVVEEFAEDSDHVCQQFIWGLRYPDDRVLGDYSTACQQLNGRKYALQDSEWSVTTLLLATSQVAARISYTCYGVPQWLAVDFEPNVSPVHVWPVLYCGYMFDQTVGLAVVRNRIYSNAIGFWLQRDPLAEINGQNLYVYANSNPILLTDPSGAIPCHQRQTWSYSMCDECPKCDCHSTAFSLKPIIPLKGSRIAIDSSIDLPGDSCLVYLKFGDCGSGGGSRTCPLPRGRDRTKTQIYICIDEDTPSCFLEGLILHELRHASQYCRLAVGPGSVLPPTTVAQEEEAYSAQCLLEAESFCLKDPDRTRYANDCVNQRKNLSINTKNTETCGQMVSRLGPWKDVPTISTCVRF